MKDKARLVIFAIISLLVTGLCFSSYVFAQDNISMEDKIIAGTLKTLAKAFVAMADLEKLKKNNMEKLNKMKEEKFQRRYAKVYEVIKDLPPKLKASYQISEQMSKEQIIRIIQSFDKKKIYQTIDAIPDTIIAKQFKRYLSEKKQEIQKSDLAEQLNKFWNNIVEKVNKPSPK